MAARQRKVEAGEVGEEIRKRGWPSRDKDNITVKSRVAKRSCMQSFIALTGAAGEQATETAAATSAADKEWEVGAALMADQGEAMKAMLRCHRRAFAFTLNELGKSKIGKMKIELTSEVPTYQRKRRMIRADEKVCMEKSTVVAAMKDMNGEVLSRRMCGDYRDLNKITKANRYPMPTPKDIFDKLEGATAFPTLDLRRGFNHIQIQEEDKTNTAFHGHVDGLSCNPPPAEEEARDEEKTSSLVLCMAAMTRGMQEADAARFKGSGPEDIWHDAEALRLVKGETEVEEEISDRARERAQYYWWYQQQLQVQSKEGWKMDGTAAGHQLVLGRPASASERGGNGVRAVQPQLQSLPIMGLGYMWSLDMAGEMPLSRKNMRYVLVTIEHVSKWVEVRALSSKSAELIAEAFTDEELHWIVAGYQFSKQAALRDNSPYYLLYGKQPMLPDNAPKVLTNVVTARTAENWAALADCRAKYLKKLMPAALENLHTAQLRDAKRYQQRQLQVGKGKGKAVEDGTEVYIREGEERHAGSGVLNRAVGGEGD
ncbi:unnamed protein product [Closterium sp. NIES-54]